MASTYVVQRTREVAFGFDSPMWHGVPALAISHFHPRSSDHRPEVQARIVHDLSAIYVRFDVKDRYVRCVASDFQQPVCKDSCVELFVQPKADCGYFNFEISGSGVLLCFYIEDPTRTPDGFVRYTPLPVDLLQQVEILHTLPERVEPEITTRVAWSVACRIPVNLLEEYVGPLGSLVGQTWRGNLYKCGDATSHPHWASWSPLGEKLNFHLPEHFGALRFA